MKRGHCLAFVDLIDFLGLDCFLKWDIAYKTTLVPYPFLVFLKYMANVNILPSQ